MNDSVARLFREFRRRWLAGDRIHVETLLARPVLRGAPAEDLVDLIYGEILVREECGEHPEVQEYLARFPEHAEALRKQFELVAFLRGPAPCF